MHEELLDELDRCAERRNFFRFGAIETELYYYYTEGRRQDFTIPNCPTEAEWLACLPEEVRSRFVKAKKRLLPNYKVDMPGSTSTEGAEKPLD